MSNNEVINSDEVRFTMRLPKKIYDVIKERSKINKRSVTKEIEYILENDFFPKGEEIRIPDDISEPLIRYLQERMKNKKKD